MTYCKKHYKWYDVCCPDCSSMSDTVNITGIGVSAIPAHEHEHVFEIPVEWEIRHRIWVEKGEWVDRKSVTKLMCKCWEIKSLTIK